MGDRPRRALLSEALDTEAVPGARVGTTRSRAERRGAPFVPQWGTATRPRSGTATSGVWSAGPPSDYSEPLDELVDPALRRERPVARAGLAASGDEEAVHLDKDFLRALEYGMPPSGGMGMGIDRMLQVFTERGIRETILFPFVRPV